MRHAKSQPGIVMVAGCLSATAVLLGLSFPLPGWGFLAWAALVPAAYAAVRCDRPWVLLALCYVVFSVWWSWMLRWLWPVTGPGVLALGVYMSAYWTAALLGTRCVVRRLGLPVAVVLPVLWVGLEWFRGVWPVGGFAWFTLGQTQAMWGVGDAPIAAQLASLLGASTIGLAIACVSGVIVDVWMGRLSRWLGGVLALGVVGLVLLNGGWVSDRAFDVKRELVSQVSLVQTRSPHDNKASPTVETLERDWAELKGLHEEAVAVGGLGGGPHAASQRGLHGGGEVALVVWPETGVPGKFDEAGSALYRRHAMTLDPLTQDGMFFRVYADMAFRARELIAAGGVPTVVGGSTLELDALGEERDYNSAFLVGPQGEIEARYDKMHLVPWGEFLPGPAWLRDSVLRWFSPYGPGNDYSIDRGERVVLFEVGEGERTLRFATPICFEDTVGRLCRAMVYDPATGAKRVDALVNLTTNGWFGRLPSGDDRGGLAWRSVRLQHLQLASLRAIENRVTVARSVNTGSSAVIAPSGQIVSMGEPGVAQVVRGPIVKDSRVTLYATVGEWPMVLVFSAGVVILVSSLVRPRCLRARHSTGEPPKPGDVTRSTSATNPHAAGTAS